jgi:hypothetical protein
MQCGSVKNDYHKMHIEETNEYLDTICGIYQCYLFNCQYHSHVEDIHILIVTNNDSLTNVQFGEMFFFYRSNFCNN